jgi:hypothetical protein
LAHDLPGFELDRRPGWNYEAASWLVWIPSDPRFRQAWLENTKVAQFNSDVLGQAVSNLVKRPLDHIEDLVLNHPCLVTDGDDDVAFG